VTIGFFSPMPPARTGVADYSAALVSALKPLASVALNAKGDINLYHLGNNHLHRDIYSRALRNPGVAVLHDAVLHHFLLGTLDREQYLDEFVFNYGPWSRSIAEALWDHRSLSVVDPRYFERPMVRRIGEASNAIIVHNPGAAAVVRAHAPSARVFEVPHLLSPPPQVPGWEVERLRQTWGVSGHTFVFGIFGHLRESKRLKSCLDAFDMVRRGNDCALLVSGEFASADLLRDLSPRLNGPGIIRMGYLSKQQFWIAANAVDTCLNLRYPGAGETSGIAMRLMGTRKPVILTASPETAGFPDGTCVRVDTGLAETEMLAAYMASLVREPAMAREIGRRGADWVRSNHAPVQAAQAYVSALNAARA
jgi:hypothetical protein